MLNFNLAKHKWQPLIKPTPFEMRASKVWNFYVYELEKCETVEEVQALQKIFKEGMINIALDPVCEHTL